MELSSKQFFRTIALLWCLFLAPVCAITTRKVWFNPDCINKGFRADVFWTTVREMKANARDAAQGKPNQNLFNYIFKSQDNTAFITSTLDAISDDLATDPNDANTLIYCDHDDRWREATSQEVAGNGERTRKPKAFIDTTNNMLYDDTPETKCNLGRLGRPVLGGTYCNSFADNKRCTITLCDPSFRFKVGKESAGLAGFKKNGQDFSITPEDDSGMPAIDYWNMLDTVILHEITHTIYNENAGKTMEWIDRAYGWKDITSLKPKFVTHNADSLAYLGLANWIQQTAGPSPYTVNEDGSITRN